MFIFVFPGPTSRGGRKLDETRDKYGKACRRLHRAHNEYVLLLAEATECERALRTAALPTLLEQQRRQGEANATSWYVLFNFRAVSTNLRPLLPDDGAHAITKLLLGGAQKF